MKNIHILPTDKPSRLWKTWELKLGLHPTITKTLLDKQHTYITSDEEIKGGDWILFNSKIYKCTIASEIEVIVYEKDEYCGSLVPEYCKKIILTTDQDLIKDGIQAIDDEFLQWFVKNPSCEEVGFEEIFPIGFSKEKRPMEHFIKKQIIISKEESKQIDWKVSTKALMEAYGDNPKDFPYEESKQETPEEAAERCFEEMKALNPKGGLKEFIRQAVNFGARWQAKKSYSGEEILEILQDFKSYLSFGDEVDEVKWFEQFKNK